MVVFQWFSSFVVTQKAVAFKSSPPKVSSNHRESCHHHHHYYHHHHHQHHFPGRHLFHHHHHHHQGIMSTSIPGRELLHILRQQVQGALRHLTPRRGLSLKRRRCQMCLQFQFLQDVLCRSYGLWQLVLLCLGPLPEIQVPEPSI